MQITVRVAVRVADVVRQQVAGEKQRAVAKHGEIRLAAQQVQLLRVGPSESAVAGAEEQVLLQHLAGFRLMLMEGREDEFAVRQEGNAGLVVVRHAERDPLAGKRLRQEAGIADADGVGGGSGFVNCGANERRPDAENSAQRDGRAGGEETSAGERCWHVGSLWREGSPGPCGPIDWQPPKINSRHAATRAAATLERLGGSLALPGGCLTESCSESSP